MHTSTTPSGRRYHHNADFSGPVHLVLAGDELETTGGACAHALIPIDDLRAIVDAADQLPECPICASPHRHHAYLIRDQAGGPAYCTDGWHHRNPTA